MEKIHRNILIGFFSIFGILLAFYIFERFCEYFGWLQYTSKNWFKSLFFEQSYCDFSEAEPTFFTLFLVILLGFSIAVLFISIIKRIENKITG